MCLTLQTLSALFVSCGDNWNVPGIFFKQPQCLSAFTEIEAVALYYIISVISTVYINLAVVHCNSLFNTKGHALLLVNELWFCVHYSLASCLKCIWTDFTTGKVWVAANLSPAVHSSVQLGFKDMTLSHEADVPKRGACLSQMFANCTLQFAIVQLAWTNCAHFNNPYSGNILILRTRKIFYRNG